MFKYLFLPLFLSTSVFSQTPLWIIDYESQLIWIALFALGIISMIMMFTLSQQTQKITKHHKKILRNRKELEETQFQFLNGIQEEMEKLKQNITQSKLLDEILSTEKERGKNIESKKKLLDSTEALIGYLKLKAESLQIQNQSFNVNNMLHELSGTLAVEFPDSEIDFIYDINHNIPKVMVGDAVHIGQVLISIVRYCIQQDSAGEIKLEMSLFNTYDEEYEIQFTITDTSMGIEEKELQVLFVPEYDEETHEYKKLEFFVAKKLVTLMNGDLTIQSTKGKGNIFVLTLPFASSTITDRRKYRLPEEMSSHKKVLIVDDRYQVALAAKKMFGYFKYVTKVLSSEAFMEQRPHMAEYDIVVLNERLFDLHLVSYIERVKEDQEIKVIALRSLFNQSSPQNTYGVIDQYLSKPFTQEQVFDLLCTLHKTNKTSILQNKAGVSITEKENRQRDSFVETPNITIDSFKDFTGSRILIVEDNIINQKVLENILGKANMHLKIANNGQEAVTIINENQGKFDMVLMDINMPVLDGYEATKLIREKYALDTFPIVALSALVLENEIKKMFQSGVNGYLQKPLSLGMLYSAFDVFIGAKRPMDEAVYPMAENIDGINIKQGIAYANENIALYKEVLDAFIAAYGDSYLVVERLSEEKQYEEMKKICLDMKGLTGSIGAYRMNDVVDRIQKSLLTENYQFIPELVGEYKSEFPKLSNAILRYIR